MTELADLVRSALGHDLDRKTFDALLAIQTKLRRTQSEMAARFDDGDISAEVYYAALNAALKEAMDANRKLLGNSQFVAIFEEAGNEPEGMVDKGIFLESARRRPRHRRK
jgi:hypothetical protein